jgi:putative membrane protein (TIGR04086 family)
MNSYTEISVNERGSFKEAAKSGFQSASYAKMAKSVVIGTIISLFVSVILLIIFAFIVNAAFGDPDRVIDIFTGIGASAGALIGGFQASKRNGSTGLVTGLLTGLTTSLVIFAVMIFGGKPADAGLINADTNASLKIILIACQIVFASIGGVFAVNSGSSGRSRNYPASSKNKKK